MGTALIDRPMRDLFQGRCVERIERPYNSSAFQKLRRDDARRASAGDPIHKILAVAHSAKRCK
jgi:hypothetical protein